MNYRNDDYSRPERSERERYRDDDERDEERKREAQASRSSFHPGEHGSQQSSHWGRDESQPYGQREPYNVRGSGREEFGRTRWGAPTDYGSRGASRYSESQYGQRRPPRDPYGRDFGGGGYRARGDNEGGRDTGSFGEDYREGQYGSGDFGFDQGARGEPSFGSSSRERYDSPRYFGSGNYGEGGSHYTGGWDPRGERSSYSSTSSTGDPSYSPRGNSGSYWGQESHQERPGLLKRLFKRGPKGYQRSDERLREDISERLMQSSHVDSSDVTVSVSSGKVSLEGSVPDRYMKHYIEDLVDACPGVQDIDNRIRVGQPASTSTATTTATSTLGSNGGRGKN